jgi:nicotinate-nucleotide adenylyltransferase
MKVGLYFGSFNPIHNGHLIIANYIISNTDLDQLWFVVSPHNPLKKSKTLLNEYHRLHLVQLAIEGETRLKASSIEFKLPKPSYTIDTLTYLKDKYPDNDFAIILGGDSFCNIDKWKNYTQLLNNYTLYIYRRPGFETGKLTGKDIRILDAPLIEISSTAIRKMINDGKSIRYFVPDTVKEEIEKNGYYKKQILK